MDDRERLEDVGFLTCMTLEPLARVLHGALLDALELHGFASDEAGNPLTPEEQEAKLSRVGEVARRVWPT